MALVLPMMSKRALLSNESSRDAEIWIFPATCSVVNATDIAVEGTAETDICTQPDILTAWQSLTNDDPIFAICQV